MTAVDQQAAGMRKLRAVVGSQISRDEEMFGAAFDRQVMRRFVGYVAPYRGALVVAVIAVLTFTASQLAIPLIIRWAIDDALLSPASGAAFLGLTVAVYAAVVLTNYAANWLQDWLVGWTGERVIFALRRAMFEHLQKVALTFMDRTEVGRMMSRLQGDVNSLQEFLDNSITAIGDLVLLVGIVAIMLALNLELGLLTLAIVPTLFLVRIVWLPRARQAFRHARETNSVTSGALAEGIRAVRTVQAMRREAVNRDLFELKARDNLKAHLRAAKFGQTMVPIVDLLTGVALAVVIVLGGSLVLRDALDIGVIVAFVFYVQRFFDPIRSLTMQYSVMQRAMASGQRIFEVLDVPLAIVDKDGATDPEDIEGRVAFRNVTFGYEKDRPVLHDVSFEVAPGETVALVGPTGSGKTSITALLHRFYEVWDGQILIDGIDVRDYTKDALARHVSMVLQDPFLFTGTILENIRYNKAGATREDVEQAAEVRRRARLHHAFAARLRHHADRARAQSVAGTAPASQFRPGAGRRYQNPDPRRGDGQHRQLHRTQDPAGARAPSEGPHRVGHRPPAGHHSWRGSDHRAEGRPHRRDRPARRLDGEERALRQLVRAELRVVRRHPRGIGATSRGQSQRDVASRRRLRAAPPDG